MCARGANGCRHGVSVGAAPEGASRPWSVNGEACEEGPRRVGQKLLGARQGHRGDEGTESGSTAWIGARRCEPEAHLVVIEWLNVRTAIDGHQRGVQCPVHVCIQCCPDCLPDFAREKGGASDRFGVRRRQRECRRGWRTRARLRSGRARQLAFDIDHEGENEITASGGEHEQKA
eukprot:2163797-Pleurochrysis_carterae.AAC.1